MTNATGMAILLVAALARGGAGEEPSGPAAPRRPFWDYRQQQPDYAGPGREQPPPENLTEVVLAYFGPDDPADPLGGDLWRAAQLAIEEANRAGGWRGKPFRLAAAWSAQPWGSGVRRLTELVYREHVWAIIGGSDGPTTHLAEQVVVKARLPLVSPISTDTTVQLTNVPWMFSLAPGDHLLVPPLAAAIAARVGEQTLVRISTDEHDARLLGKELTQELARCRRVAKFQFECRPGERELGPLLQRVAAARPAAVVVLAGAEDSARLVTALRGQGYRGAVFGGPAMGRRRFLELAGEAAAGAVFPLLSDPAQLSPAFTAAFMEQAGYAPDAAAAQAYDAVRLLVAAIHRAGLNRARLRDALAALSPWPGAAGPVTWDRSGGNTRPAVLGTIRDGRVVRWPGELAPPGDDRERGGTVRQEGARGAGSASRSTPACGGSSRAGRSPDAAPLSPPRQGYSFPATYCS